MGITAGNLGITFFLQQKYDQAIPLLKFDVQEIFKAREVDNGLSSLLTLMRIYQERQNWKELNKRIPVVRKMLPFTGNPVQHLKPFYIILSKLNASLSNFEKAYKYADSITIVNDTINTRRNTFLLARAEQKVEVKQHEAEIAKLAAQKEIQKFWTISLAIGVVLLVIIAFLVLKQQRMRYRNRQEQLRLQKESVEMELQHARVELQDFTRRIINKRKLIEQFEAELQDIRAANGLRVSEASQTLAQLQQATILTEEQWESFRQKFEKVHRGFLQNLKEKVPGLSPAETRFMVLSKLGLSNREMAGMLGVSTEAIRQTRHRIRKKLEIPGAETVEELVASI
jgi:DNA-binding CsgD family transcriptional regulator